jgi:hypothetical protein
MEPRLAARRLSLLLVALLASCTPASVARDPDTARRVRVIGEADARSREACEEKVSAILPDLADIEVSLELELEPELAGPDIMNRPVAPSPSGPRRVIAEIKAHHGNAVVRGAGAGLTASSACGIAAERVASTLR